jgi:hypothetical protein
MACLAAFPVTTSLGTTCGVLGGGAPPHHIRLQGIINTMRLIWPAQLWVLTLCRALSLMNAAMQAKSAKDEVNPTDAIRLGVRVMDRIGITTPLLVGSVLALLIAVTTVQAWTLWAVQENGLERAQNSLLNSMAMLRHELAPLGNVWRPTPDGSVTSRAVLPWSERRELCDHATCIIPIAM